MSNKGALATLDDDAAIAEIASGILSKDIASRYGVTPYAVRKRLAKHPDYAQAIKDQAEAFIEDAVQAVRDCPDDQVAIARARVTVDTAFKYAAARDPATWGQRTTLTVDIGSNLAEALTRTRERPIEGESVRIEEKP